MLLNTYRHIPLKPVSGSGAWLFTDQGVFLDTFTGIGVNVLGYNHPEIAAEAEKQFKKYTHLSNYFLSDEVKQLSDEICLQTGCSGVFFTNSGTEAVEAALKLIRKYFNKTGKRNLFALKRAFHGRTMGALSLCYKNSIKDSFDPLFSVEYIDQETQSGIEKIDQNTAAVFLETVQGEGGIFRLSDEFICNLSSLREKYGFLIAADEIQSGLYRTGSFCAFQKTMLKPDIVLLGKGIGGGLPLGVCCADERLSFVFSPGDHGSTFGGNPLSCSLGLKTLNIIKRDSLAEKIIEKGQLFRDMLQKSSEKRPDLIAEVRGSGFMNGVEFRSSETAKLFSQFAFKKRILVNITSEKVWRILPSYLFDISQIQRTVSMFSDFLTNSL